jgi:transcriptional regulator of heat shock response
VPTDKGFRYFVNQLMDRVSLGMEEQQLLKKEMLKLQMAHVEMGRRLAKLLSDHSQQASFAIFPEEVSTTGISKILNTPGLPAEDAKEIARFFDDIDQYAEKMIAEYADQGSPKTFIGKEIQLSPKSGYSMIVSRLELPSGKKGVIGLVGPKSMQYNF